MMAGGAPAYDYIVVGAGSAGAVVAARLTEDPKTSVLLIEAGPGDAGFFSHVPLWWAKIIAHPRCTWMHRAAPEPQLEGRRLPVPHGKVLGGSSTVNGLVWVRGLEIDYRTWEEMGARGWGYQDVLPYFKKSESWPGGTDEWHGRNGPIHVENARWKTPLGDAFISAAMDALDLPRNDDFNGPHANGAGYWPLNTRRGRRSSTAEAYLKPNRKRPNLHILTEAFVTRVEFEGREAVGVVYEQGGKVQRARVNREIVLSAGALQTPQLLQVSGIGPGDLLARHGIAVVQELKGVGENLMDHVQLARIYETDSRHTLNAKVRSYFGQFLGGVEYYVGRVGDRSPSALRSPVPITGRRLAWNSPTSIFTSCRMRQARQAMTLPSNRASASPCIPAAPRAGVMSASSRRTCGSSLRYSSIICPTKRMSKLS